MPGPIYAVDVHPKGGKLATAGGDNVLHVWNMVPILDETQELKSEVPKLLATLTEHSGPVNAVRFSNNGKYMASGSDDRTALIYELRAGRGTAAFGSSNPNIENWKVCQALRGHANNIVDLAWSKDDRFIATASLDGSIIIWNVEDISHPVRVHTIVGHVGFVKGVAWDPMGTYLASQGDDGLRVWRCNSWSQVAYIREHWRHASTRNFHLR